MRHLSILKPGFGILSARQEEEFRNYQQEVVSPHLKKALVVLSVGLWIFYYFNRDRFVGSSQFGLYAVLFQAYAVLTYYSLDLRKNMRKFINCFTPGFTGFILYIFMIHYVPFLTNESTMIQAQVMPLLAVISIYTFEKISPTYTIRHALIFSSLYLYFRANAPALAELPQWQIWTQLIIANAIGLVIAVDQGITSRRQFKLQKKLDSKNKIANSLINSVFPPKVARELQLTRAHSARQYDNVTIMFADIVNYTELSASLSPKRLVSVLRDLFQEFDHQAEKYKVEKIKTIGDAYMAVCGCPQATADHAENIAKFSLAVMNKVQSFNKRHGTDIDIRIGVHTGSVIAGVITGKRMSFDMWGEAVNLASRIQNYAEPGEILIGEKTAKILGARFLVSDVKFAELKGVGPTPLRKLHGDKRLAEKSHYSSTKNILIYSHVPEQLDMAC